MTCAVCGAQNETGAAFCFRCGSSLKPGTPAATGPTVNLSRDDTPAMRARTSTDDESNARVYDVPPTFGDAGAQPYNAPDTPPQYSMSGQSPMSPPASNQPYSVGTMAQQSNTALIALVLAILSYVGLSLLGAIPAVILGRNARLEIQRSGGLITGDGMAQAAIVLGWINIALSVVGFCMICVLPILGIGIFGISAPR